MLAELGGVIDQLYKQKLSGKIPRRRLVFLIGDGIRHVCSILNDGQITKEAAKRGISTNPRTRGFQEFKWRLFEFARYYTANTLPTFAHACVNQMVVDGVCRDLVTTNYDLFFDSIWEKYPALGVRQNPVVGSEEYCWADYCSPRLAARKKPRYWKIHGSLSHIVFQGRNHPAQRQIHRLPRFPISTNQPDLAKAFGMKSLAPYMGYEAGRFLRTQFAHPDFLQAQFEPFIDWSCGNKRSMFRREIRHASRIICEKRSVAAIVVIGFRGYHNEANPADSRNEELVPVIDAILDEGDPPVFMAVHEKQYVQRHEPTSRLIRRLDRIGRCHPYNEVGMFMQKLLRPPNCHSFPFDTAWNEYKIWSNHWFLTMKEPAHA